MTLSNTAEDNAKNQLIKKKTTEIWNPLMYSSHTTQKKTAIQDKQKTPEKGVEKT